MSVCLLKLYIAGNTARARQAIRNLENICRQDLAGQYRLEVVDVTQQPELAESEKIIATPTVIKELPPPVRRVIGDLSDADKVLVGLEIQPMNGDRSDRLVPGEKARDSFHE